MITARTAIGIAVGSIIIGLATASMILDLTRGPLEITEEVDVGMSTTYQINGDAGASHTITVTGDRFQMGLQYPDEQDDAPQTEHQDSHTVEWSQEQAGRTYIIIQNIGSDVLVVDGVFLVTTDPIFLAYHVVVITSGVVIIGFSLGFSLRKPRGF